MCCILVDSWGWVVDEKEEPFFPSRPDCQPKAVRSWMALSVLWLRLCYWEMWYYDLNPGPSCCDPMFGIYIYILYMIEIYLWYKVSHTEWSAHSVNFGIPIIEFQQLATRGQCCFTSMPPPSYFEANSRHHIYISSIKVSVFLLRKAWTF